MTFALQTAKIQFRIVYFMHVPVKTGGNSGSLLEASPDWEQQVPHLAEAELQPAGGGVAALEVSPQAFDLWESSMGQQVWQLLSALIKISCLAVDF